jgi:choice-of-anchor B domain-containing protein
VKGPIARRRPRALAWLALALACLLAPVAVAARDHPTIDAGGARGGPTDEFADASGYGYGRGRVDKLTPLGTLSLPGYNADVWAHKGFAYVGTWGNAAGYPSRCPATGVRIIDLADPANPALVGAVATIPGTSQEDVVVKRVETAAFKGDLLVTGIQPCERTTSAQRGIDLWDVTNPRAPQHLGFWSSGPVGPAGTRGVHELHLFLRDGRAYVAAAVPYAEIYEGTGDFRIVDVSDPRNPVQVSEWGITTDGGIRPGSGQAFFDHSAWTNAAGTLAVLSWWDAGVVFLDITDLANPKYLGRTIYGSGGATHSVWFTADEKRLLVADEILAPRPTGWGGMRVFDVQNPAAPVEIARYDTPNSLTTRRDGTYTIHNPFVVGDRAFLSWYSDGIRVLDIGNPAQPREVASFVPPATPDPFGTYPPSAQVWGVYVEGDLVLASDINAGLYVLRYGR